MCSGFNNKTYCFAGHEMLEQETSRPIYFGKYYDFVNIPTDSAFINFYTLLYGINFTTVSILVCLTGEVRFHSIFSMLWYCMW